MPKLILIAHVLTDSVNEGFLPAARDLGLEVVLLTDHAEAHRKHFAASGLPAYPQEIIECDVFNPVSVIAEISRQPQRPAAIFSNSDHLQVSTALAAQYFGLPGKDWKVAFRTKNKAAMRESLRAQDVDCLWYTVVANEAEIEAIPKIPYPCVIKPREGVGSQLVRLCENEKALCSHARDVWRYDAGRPMLIEEYMAGDLYTFETLGDATDIVFLGGFHVSLGLPPNFVEMEARWDNWLTPSQKQEVLRQIKAVGVGFGSCHTEFVLTNMGPRLIEINYRTVGDQREFMLVHTLGIPLFEKILRIHLGEPLGECPIADRVAAIRYFIADQNGEVLAAPQGFLRTGGELRVEYRALRAPGDNITVTHSNKDYLGVLSVSAPDNDALDTAMTEARDQLAWEFADKPRQSLP